MAKPNNKDVTVQTVYNRTITETGEVLQEERITKVRFEREPDFVKLYLKDILYLNDLPKTSNGILFQLLTVMDYDNKIQITAGFKRQIAKDLGIGENTVKQAIFNFQKKNIISKVDTGMYIVNPFYFGRGEWKNIKRLRLSIEYGDNLRSIDDITIEKIIDEQPTSQEDSDN